MVEYAKERCEGVGGGFQVGWMDGMKEGRRRTEDEVGRKPSFEYHLRNGPQQ